MADILIRGMEMPENCGECKAFVCYRQWAGDSGDCFCGITKVDAKADARNADCPLAPLPEGHGRLIDADDALKKIPIPTGGVSSVDIYNNIEYFIETRPTIVPAEGGGEDG